MLSYAPINRYNGVFQEKKNEDFRWRRVFSAFSAKPQQDQLSLRMCAKWLRGIFFPQRQHHLMFETRSCIAES